MNCGAAGGSRVGVVTAPSPSFGRSVNPISTRGADYANHITKCLPLGFSHLPMALKLVIKCHTIGVKTSKNSLSTLSIKYFMNKGRLSFVFQGHAIRGLNFKPLKIHYPPFENVIFNNVFHGWSLAFCVSFFFCCFLINKYDIGRVVCAPLFDEHVCFLVVFKTA